AECRPPAAWLRVARAYAYPGRPAPPSPRTPCSDAGSKARYAPCPRRPRSSRMGVVELVEHHDMAGAVENGDGHAPVVLHRLRLRGRHHFFGCLESNGRSIRRCRRWGWRLLRGGCRCCQNDGKDGSESCFALPLHLFPPISACRLAPKAFKIGLSEQRINELKNRLDAYVRARQADRCLAAAPRPHHRTWSAPGGHNSSAGRMTSQMFQ